MFIAGHPIDRQLQRFGFNVSAMPKPFTADDLARFAQEIRAGIAHSALAKRRGRPHLLR